MTPTMHLPVVVTGANSGIGLAAVGELAKRGVPVVMGCRSPERGQAALESIVADHPDADVHLLAVDLASFDSVDAFVAQVAERWSAVGALINNAAVFDLTQQEPIDTDDGFERVWQTNYLGPRRLTDQLRPALEAAGPGRVVDVCSKGLLAHPFMTIDLDDLDGRGNFSAERAYYRSKLALLSHTLFLARTAESDRLVANAVWVPAVKVDDSKIPPMPTWKRKIYDLKRRAALDPADMAPVYADLATSPVWAGRTGWIVDHRGKRVKPVRNVRSDAAGDALEAATRRSLAAVGDERD